MPIDVQPYRVHVPESDLIELRARLARTRWPEAAPAPGWAQGVPLEVVQDLCRYWAEEYEWRSAEARLNTVPQYLVGVDGLKVHVLHARSLRIRGHCRWCSLRLARLGARTGQPRRAADRSGASRWCA
jgi:hypothetical protein